jgi:gamma-glutamyl-gamma-aminobutyraldehyde dehydrogenase
LVLTATEPTTLAHWSDLAADVTPRTGIFIDGQFRDAQSGETFESVNPATGELLARIASAQDADVDAAVASGRAAFESGGWAKASPAERKRVLARLAELIGEHSAELALLDSLDMGKLVTEAYNVDVPSAADLSPSTARRWTRSAGKSPRQNPAISPSSAESPLASSAR